MSETEQSSLEEFLDEVDRTVVWLIATIAERIRSSGDPRLIYCRNVHLVAAGVFFRDNTDADALDPTTREAIDALIRRALARQELLRATGSTATGEGN